MNTLKNIIQSNEERNGFFSNRLFQILAAIFILSWFYFFATTRDLTNWWIENILVLLFIPWFYFLNRKFLFSNTSLIFLFFFLWIHIYGAQMSYTYNTAGEWFRTTFDLWRNPYDRFVHFNFGLLMVFPTWDYLVYRWQAPVKWSYFIATLLLFAMATFFELIEWFVAAISDSATGETYVATQGDVWDAHKDIGLAWIAATLVMTLLCFYINKKRSTVQTP